MNFDLKWGLYDLQQAVSHLQQAIPAYRWSDEEKRQIVYAKWLIDQIVTKRLAE